MSEQPDYTFQENLVSRTDFELFYEFVMWDYSESNSELEKIKSEVRSRNNSRKLLKFSASALLVNFSLLYFESTYGYRWEFFETESKDIWPSIRIGFSLQLIFFLALAVPIYLINELVGKILFASIMTALLFPIFWKTFIDIKNYSRSSGATEL